ncbi:MAG TPA: hypothetical protein VF553_04050 [Pyrinomonadaceae bacterium]|jgi:hypothetical protein
MLNRTLLFFLAIVSLAAFAGAAQAQIGRDPFNPRGEKDPLLGSAEEEMHDRMEVERSEKVRRENLERAREVAQLGTELREAYITHKALERSEIKKLERLEKLTRRIRSEAGGSDDDEPMKDAPRELDAALERIAELSMELRKGVEKTPRLVISAAVIDRANQLLELIGFVRTLSH